MCVGGKEGELANENEATVALFVGSLCMADAIKVGMGCPYFQSVNAFYYITNIYFAFIQK